MNCAFVSTRVESIYLKLSGSDAVGVEPRFGAAVCFAAAARAAVVAAVASVASLDHAVVVGAVAGAATLAVSCDAVVASVGAACSHWFCC